MGEGIILEDVIIYLQAVGISKGKKAFFKVRLTEHLTFCSEFTENF